MVVPVKSLLPATVCVVVKSTKFLVLEPVPPFAIANIPEEMSLIVILAQIFVEVEFAFKN